MEEVISPTKAVSVNSKTTLSIAAMIYLIIACASTYYIAQSRYASALHTLQLQLTANGERKSETLDFWISKLQADVQFLKKVPPIQQIIRARTQGTDPTTNQDLSIWYSRLNTIFHGYMSANPELLQIRYISIADKGHELIRVNRVGDTTVSVPPSQLQAKSHRDYFQAISQLQENQVYVSPISLNREFGQLETPYTPTLRVGTPVFDEQGQRFGMLVLNFGASAILKQMASSQPDNLATKTLLVNETGDYLVHPDASKTFGFEFGKSYRWSDDFYTLTPQLIQVRSPQSFLGHENQAYFKAHTITLQTPDRQITLYTLVPKSVVRTQVLWSALYTAAMFAIVAIIFGLVIFHLRTTNHLENQQTKLRAKIELEKRFALVVESAPCGMILVGKDGRIELVNAQTEQLFGYSRKELIGQVLEILLPEEFRHAHPKLRSQFFSRASQRPMGAGKDLFGRRKNASQFPIEVGLSPIQTDGATKVLATIVDLTERHQFINNLTEVNHALDNFAYVASHDLKAPLHGIDKLATWLSEDLADKADEDDLEHLRLMRVRINRMENLLSDLLIYSRAGRINSELSTTNTAELIKDAFEMGSPTSGFSLHLAGEFPTGKTARIPLEQVFRNLFSNALKHHDKTDGKIVVSVEAANNLYRFSVADDGPGIPPEHYERVFAMFQTLRPRDEVEGSGMGLAIVKKTIESQGGTIQLTANQPRGACFVFTWPITNLNAR